MQGEIRCSGAKNSVLPLLAASILLREPLSLDRIPHLQDISVMLDLLSSMGARVKLSFLETEDADFRLELSSQKLHSMQAPYDRVHAMRASVLVLGPLLARYGHAEVAMPGGCAIGARPIDQHLSALRQMGAQLEVTEGVIHARVKDRLKGADIRLDMPSVTGTENILMAACMAEGETLIRQAAREPEVVDLAAFLNAAGADITGAGGDEIHIRGVKELSGGMYSVIPDRIETATYLTAAVATGGAVTVRGCIPGHMEAICEKLALCGAELSSGEDWISVDMKGRRPQAVSFRTEHYPGFPTDIQAPFLALNAVAEGEARMTETIFENRFRHAQEINRMGARIRIFGNTALSEGQKTLTGAEVEASDLRAAASLIIAGLVASGETLISGISYIDRGYERIEEKLRRLGADIRRIQ